MKKKIHWARMEDDFAEELPDLTEAMFEDTYKSLAKKPGSKYDFIMKAGDSLKPALYNLYSIEWRSEELPTGWSTSSLVQLYKGSGPQNELKNYRFIHMKDDFQKFFGHIVLS